MPPSHFHSLLFQRGLHPAYLCLSLIQEEEQTPRTIPKLGLVSAPVQHRLLSRARTIQQKDEVDVIIRMMSDSQPHRATLHYGCKAQRSIVDQCLQKPFIRSGPLLIGHTSSKIPAVASVDSNGIVESVTVCVRRGSWWRVKCYP